MNCIAWVEGNHWGQIYSCNARTCVGESYCPEHGGHPLMDEFPVGEYLNRLYAVKVNLEAARAAYKCCHERERLRGKREGLELAIRCLRELRKDTK